MITIRQIDAALGLLGVSRSDLAEQMGFNKSTLNSYFTGKAQIPSGKLGDIQKWLENSGIVFTDQGGVNPNISDIVTYEGVQGFRTFMDDVYETARRYGGGIYLFNSRPKLWYEWLGKEWYDMHSSRMGALGERIQVKITVQEGDSFFILGTAAHRWFPKRLSKDKIFYAYGPKLAFLDFSENEISISVVTQKDFADIFRELYDIAWENVTLEIPENKQ